MKYITKSSLNKIIRGRKKGDNGKVLIIGGSKEYTGAVALAGLACLRSGVDWVTIAAPEKVAWAINALSPDLVTYKLKGDYLEKKHVKTLLDLEKKYDIVLIGNGISLKSKDFVKQYVKRSKKPLVIDADAIKAISLDIVNNAIITPHEREMEILLENSKINNSVKLANKIRDNVILLKGKVDKIISKDKLLFNKTGNPGMTKAGTGDVLAGLCAGFYTQLKNNVEAAKSAAYYTGLAGDILAKKKKGYTYLASDLVEEINKFR